MILFLHNRYRTTGGEERVLEDLMWLVDEHLGERAQLIARDSSHMGRTKAALGLLRGGLSPAEVAYAVRSTGARVVHAHNLHPAFGWRSLEAARNAGAKVVLHLHQYRLVCAVGVCFTAGDQCTRCHGSNTLPGVLRNCRKSVPEALTYGLALAMWQRRLIEQADVVIAPSEFALARLSELGAPLEKAQSRVLAPLIRSRAARSSAGQGAYALVVSRLSAEKGVDVAIDACLQAGRPLVVAGDGPERQALLSRAERGPQGLVSFVGHVDDSELAELRARASVAIVPSRSAESFGVAAAEAMAAGLPVLASRIGAQPELVEEQGLVEPGDHDALADALERLWGDEQAGERALDRVWEHCAPERVARSLQSIYAETAQGEGLT